MRVLLRWQFAGRFAVFGGPTCNGYLDFAGDRHWIGHGWFTGRVPIEDPISVRLWPASRSGSSSEYAAEPPRSPPAGRTRPRSIAPGHETTPAL